MGEVKQYRKKPIVVEAIQLTGDSDNLIEVANFLGNQYIDSGPEGQVFIETLEGDMTASVDDFIVRGIQGEHYPVKPDIFADTYDKED